MSDVLKPFELPASLSKQDAVAAMCVWEEINEITRQGQENTREDWIGYRDMTGSNELREECVALGRYAVAVYDEVDEEALDAHSFDYAVVPEILRNVTFVEGAGRWAGEKGLEMVVPSVEEMAAKLTDTFGFDNYAAEANRILKERYAIDFDGDVGMSREDFRQTYWVGDPSERLSPSEAADHEGRKNGLQRTDAAFRPK